VLLSSPLRVRGFRVLSFCGGGIDGGRGLVGARKEAGGRGKWANGAEKWREREEVGVGKEGAG